MRALVVGLGRMGRFHRRALRDLGLDVTSVDPDPRAGAAHLSMPSSRGFDVVCVAAPIRHLAEAAAEWAGHDGWLLVEKPFAACLGDAVALRDALEGQRVAVGYVERFNPRVRELRERLAGQRVEAATFTRWNDRPSDDVALDLTSHDVDLARYLGVARPVFDSRAGVPVRRREIAACELRADLLDHDASPLHAQWHAFLSDREGYATPASAVIVHRALAWEREAVAA